MVSICSFIIVAQKSTYIYTEMKGILIYSVLTEIKVSYLEGVLDTIELYIFDIEGFLLDFLLHFHHE